MILRLKKLELEKGSGLHIYKIEFPSRMDALCQAWLNLPPGSGEEDENVKSLQTDKLTDRRTDERQQAIRKAHLSFLLRKAKKKSK